MGKLIPDSRPGRVKYIPASTDEERNYTSTFTSLTDHFEPKDQYDRKIVQVAVGGQTVLNEHVERLGRLIEARGEHSILVRRKLDGEYCSCYNAITKSIMRKYCLECFGTRIVGGYQLFVNQDREDGKITIARPFADETVSMEEWGRDWTNESEWWTLPWFPLTQGNVTQSYDFIINYNEDGTELGRFYVSATKPSRSMGNKVTYQKFAARLADRPTYDNLGTLIRRGDLIYELDISTLSKIYGGKPV